MRHDRVAEPLHEFGAGAEAPEEQAVAYLYVFLDVGGFDAAAGFEHGEEVLEDAEGELGGFQEHVVGEVDDAAVGEDFLAAVLEVLCFGVPHVEVGWLLVADGPDADGAAEDVGEVGEAGVAVEVGMGDDDAALSA